MQDKELLELAANATGYDWQWVENNKGDGLVPGMLHRDEVNDVDYWFPWNPLLNNNEAFELAVDLGMDLRIVTLPHIIHINATTHSATTMEVLYSSLITAQPDKQAATRRAIVKTAAKLGLNK